MAKRMCSGSFGAAEGATANGLAGRQSARAEQRHGEHLNAAGAEGTLTY